MNPQDIPAEITKLMWTAPFVSISPTEHINLTAPDTRAVLAHFWSAIEAHLREQIATEIEALINVGYGTPVTAGMQMALNVVRRAKA